jgi:hypothetical protein
MLTRGNTQYSMFSKTLVSETPFPSNEVFGPLDLGANFAFAILYSQNEVDPNVDRIGKF